MTSTIELIRERFSCRAYLEKPVEPEIRRWLMEYLEAHRTGPFGNRVRFCLAAAESGDARSLRDLGTYGLIKNPQGFIIGALAPGVRNLEDFGYAMESAVLAATGLGLGTCWLGGSFRKTSFENRIGVSGDETVPAVVSFGYSADPDRSGGWIGRRVGRTRRRPPEEMFFLETFGRPLHADQAGLLAPALEAVRWGPSASNKQPWRIVLGGAGWHFYLQRTPGYGPDGILRRLRGMADLQRLDMGIAMCHFDFAARELGRSGRWEIADPEIVTPDKLTEYTATWRGVA